MSAGLPPWAAGAALTLGAHGALAALLALATAPDPRAEPQDGGQAEFDIVSYPVPQSTAAEQRPEAEAAATGSASGLPAAGAAIPASRAAARAPESSRLTAQAPAIEPAAALGQQGQATFAATPRPVPAVAVTPGGQGLAARPLQLDSAASALPVAAPLAVIAASQPALAPLAAASATLVPVVPAAQMLGGQDAPRPPALAPLAREGQTLSGQRVPHSPSIPASVATVARLAAATAEPAKLPAARVPAAALGAAQVLPVAARLVAPVGQLAAFAVPQLPAAPVVPPPADRLAADLPALPPRAAVTPSAASIAPAVAPAGMALAAAAIRPEPLPVALPSLPRAEPTALESPSVAALAPATGTRSAIAPAAAPAVPVAPAGMALAAAATRPEPLPVALPKAAPAEAAIPRSPTAPAQALAAAPAAPQIPEAVALNAARESPQALPHLTPGGHRAGQPDLASLAAPMHELPPRAERQTAALAWSGAGQREIDPVSLAAIQSFAQAGDPGQGAKQVRDEIGALLAAVPCARLQTVFDPASGTLALRGHVPEAGLRAPVLTALGAQVGGAIPLRDDTIILPRPVCGVLAGIDAVGLAQSDEQDADPRVVGQQPFAAVKQFAEGQILEFEVQGPDYPAYFYVDYFDADGQVLHLQPNALVPPRQIAPKAVEAVGHDADGKPAITITVTPPFGQEIMAAFAVSTPLYAGLRPTVEPAAVYLAFLQDAVAQARATDPEFRGEWFYFISVTAPR